MNRLIVLLAILGCNAFLEAQRNSLAAALSSRIVEDTTRSLLLEVSDSPQAIDEIRVELPRYSAEGAVLASAPKDWKLERDGRSIKLSGPAERRPLRLRVMLFDVGLLDRVATRLRSQGKDLLNDRLMVKELPAMHAAATPAGFLEFPAVLHPGETIEMKVLDPTHTPGDGQWIIGGEAAKAAGPDRIRVQLPADLRLGSPLRASYFDLWGERIVDALSVQDSTVTQSPANPSTTPRITACAKYAFLGQSVCVCGEFPESTWNRIKIDGQSANVLSASRQVLRIALPDSLAPGLHVITGDSSAGFSEQDKASVMALRMRGSIDANALLRGQSTTLRLGVEGTTDPMKMTVVNKSPGVISIPGGNYQEFETPGGENNATERRVDATGRGNFSIGYSLEGSRCPCEADTPQSRPSSASQNNLFFVPRRVLATIAIGTPAAMYATAQAIALANGLAVVAVYPIALTNEGLAVFEILDGIGAIAKVAALAADPRVTLAQPDVVYDTSQGPPVPADLLYGQRMMGADLVQGISRGDGVRVAVIDTGIDTGNTDLRQKIAEYADVTGAGWTPDAHGSLVAGVIAADSSKGTGSGGIAPGSKLVGVKSCLPQSSRGAAAQCWSSTLVRGIDLASQKNVRVMNLSVGGPDDKLLARVVDAATKKGITVISAAGNDGPSGKPSYPAAFKGVIAVTAVDAAAQLYPQATRGNYVDLSAPGVDIISTGPGGRSQAFSGTSAATAFASGGVALLLQLRPNLTGAEIQKLLEQTAKDLGPAGQDPEFGYGLIDICRAIVKLSGRQAACR